MKKKTLISVIVPNYNSKKTIRLCLNAIYKQDYSHFEVIVVDDVSSDESLDIVKKYPCKIVKSKINGGPGAARNLGTAEAKGKILFFVDSDVALKSDALSIAEDILQKNPQLGAVCGIYDQKPLIRDSFVEEYRSLQDYYWKKSSAGYITTLNVANGAIRKKVFDELRGFNPNLRASEDIEFGNRISKKYKILSTPKIIGKHDGDDQLSKILKNFYKRSKARVYLFVKKKGFNKGYATKNRGVGSIFAGLGLITLLLGILSPFLLVIPVLFFISFLFSDLGQYLFVLKERGLFFLIYFIFIHYLVNLAIIFGVINGTFSYIFKIGKKCLKK